MIFNIVIIEVRAASEVLVAPKVTEEFVSLAIEPSVIMKLITLKEVTPEKVRVMSQSP